jgi:hypothetical protein
MKVSDQLPAPAALLLVLKNPGTLWLKGLDGTKAGLDIFMKGDF